MSATMEVRAGEPMLDSCPSGKVTYRTYHSAERAYRKIQRFGKLRKTRGSQFHLGIYRCPECHQYHLGACRTEER